MDQYEYRVTGDAARDGSDTQTALKSFFEDTLESGSYADARDVILEEYDDQGSKAYAVTVDGIEIGSIRGDDAAGIAELGGKARELEVVFGVNGHDIEEYEKIIDRYKDKKFWKEEDPDFNDQEVNKAYNDLMEGLKEKAVYQAVLRRPSAGGTGSAAAAQDEELSEEEKQRQENMDRFVKYFKMAFPLSVLLVVIGILYLIKLSTIMGLLNLFFGALGMYFSWKYTKPARDKKKKQ